MPIDFTKAAIAVSGGLSATCALCEHYHAAADQGASWCGQNCGGPMSGGAFEKYRGPIVDFSKACFVCGSPSTHAIRASGNVRVLGCCTAHVDTVKQWKPVNKPPVNVIILSPTDEKATDELAVPRTKVRLKLV